MVRKVLKRIFCVVMCLLMCGSMAAIALEVDSPEPVEPRYSNISNHGCALVISGVNSTSSAFMHAKKSMSIETWNSSKTGTYLTMEEDRLINVLADYRLKVTFTAGSETVVSYAYPK